MLNIGEKAESIRRIRLVELVDIIDREEQWQQEIQLVISLNVMHVGESYTKIKYSRENTK